MSEDRPVYTPEPGKERTMILRDERGFLEYRFAPGRTCEIVDIEVQGEYRGQGVGKRLVNWLLREICPAHGVRLVYAITRTENMTAQRWYEKMHFRVVAVLREFYTDTRMVDAIMFGRDVEDANR